MTDVRLKVVDVTEFYSQRGGGVRSHLTLKGRMSRELGHDHVVVAPGPREGRSSGVETACPGALPPAWSNSRIAPRLLWVAGPSLPYDPTYHLLWRVDKTRALVMREAPDVVEIHSPYAAAVACLSLPRGAYGVRTFVWHSDFIDTYASVIGRRLGLGSDARVRSLLEPLWRWVRFIASRCDATFVASQHSLDKLASHGIPRLVRVPFGVDRVCFSPSARSDDLRKELLGGREGVPLLVAAGRFAVEKRWDVVLEAFERVHAQTPCRLVLLGDGPERGAIAAVASRIGPDLRVLGFEADRQRLAAVLASADVLVHGCPHETFGLAVAEALSAGLPAVVPDRGGASELVDAECSETYATGNSRACARALLRVLERLRVTGRTELRSAARRAAQRLPTPREHFEALYEAYSRLLRDRGAKGARGLCFRV
jgi:alpha-1,6-mannosyltransferase